MNRRIAGLLSIANLVVVIAGMVLFATVQIRAGVDAWVNDPVGQTLLGLAFIAFPFLGALIVSRQPRNILGWIFCGIGLVLGVGSAAQAYSEYVVAGVTDPGIAEYLAAWIANWWWLALLGSALFLVPWLFPTGRLPSRRWRLFFWPGVIAIVGTIAIAMTEPRLVAEIEDAVIYDFANPLGLAAMGDAEDGPIAGILFAIAGIGLVAGAVSLVARFRASRGVERQQLKWFTFAAAFIPVEMLLAEVVPFVEESTAVLGVVIAGLPVAAGIAILKYRLYDIDLIINRTLVYGFLTAILACVYVALVFSLQAALAPLTAESDLAIAASTLAVAALFRPLRHRVQAFIDRRFYRRKFDVQTTLDGFASHLRDEVDLGQMSAQLVTVVSDTMQPSHISLWLRTSGDAS